MIKGSDCIVKIIKENGVTDVFGYPGATVCHLMDSLEKETSINNHLNYHEQASAFAACGYAQSSGKVGVAYANGGPGFTNLITGIANAFYDSIPIVFICGQVDVSDMVGDRAIRQNGIQEVPISRIADSFVKKAIFVDKVESLEACVREAFDLAQEGRPGPVLLEIPANVQRGELEENGEKQKLAKNVDRSMFETVVVQLQKAKRPCLLVGNGVKMSGLKDQFRQCAKIMKIPVLFTLPAIDLLEFDSEYNMGYVGNNGFRYSNYVLYKSDLIISVGVRFDVKVVGKDKNAFSHGADIVRIDIDKNELSEKVSENEIQINADARDFFSWIINNNCCIDSTNWLRICKELKSELYGYDFKDYHYILQKLFEKADEDACFTADVGHHEIYMAQSLKVKSDQCAIFSLGLASMGYSLPAAIGAYYSKKSQIISMSGDGGIQMNIQELQYIAKEQIPVKILVFNNNALGMVREFQERNFNKIYCNTTEAYGYVVPSFEKLAYAYGISYTRINDSIDDINKFEYKKNVPELIEINISDSTYLYPRYIRGKRICDMEPELETILREKIDIL